MENLQEINLVELNSQEISNTEGGILDILVAAATLTAAVYGGGYACGQAYYYLTH